MEKQRENKEDLFYALFEQKYEINAHARYELPLLYQGKREKHGGKKISITEQLLHTTLTENKNFEYFSFLFWGSVLSQGVSATTGKGE